MPFLHAFVPEPGSSVIFFVIIIDETGSVEGVYSEKLIRVSIWFASRSRGENVCRILLTGWFMSANTEAQGSGRGLEAMKW
ncbi:hypothetical protein AAIH50_34380, partial [Pseudomonas aeruginosa]|uniref:hypothetical protein n=1 Tax=Pseudomonas aeruginosa TaxID=287 RepID=UPI0031B67CA6